MLIGLTSIWNESIVWRVGSINPPIASEMSSLSWLHLTRSLAIHMYVYMTYDRPYITRTSPACCQLPARRQHVPWTLWLNHLALASQKGTVFLGNVYMLNVFMLGEIVLVDQSSKNSSMTLTHWGRVTHICVSNLTIIGADNGLSPGRRQAITCTNVGILLIGPLGTNFSEMLIEIQTFLFKKINLKRSSGKWRPFCLGLNVLTVCVSRVRRRVQHWRFPMPW